MAFTEQDKQQASDIFHAYFKRRVSDGTVVKEPWNLIDAIAEAIAAARCQGTTSNPAVDRATRRPGDEFWMTKD